MYRLYLFARENSVIASVGLLAVAVGWLTPDAVERGMSASNLLLPLTFVALPFLLLLAVRPVFAAITVVAFAFVHPSLLPPLIELGQLSLRYTDVVFALLIGMLMARMAFQRRIAISKEFWELFVPLLLFLLYIGISLIIVHTLAPSFFAASVASYMRLILTAFSALVVHLTLKDAWDMQVFHKGLIILSVVAVAVGACFAWAGLEPRDLELPATRPGEATLSSARFGGVLGTGSFGFVSGLLIVYGFVKRDDKSRSMGWILSLVLGSLGLFLAKSAISVFAAAGAVTVYLAAMRSRRIRAPGLVRWAAIGTIAGMAAASAVWMLRPSDASMVLNVSGGSFADRLMIAYAGLWIFLDNPLFGVGWQASTAEPVIGSYALRAALMEKFTELPTGYFSKPPTSLHNMYIQFLAELGIIGFVLFAWACFRAGKTVARIVKNVPTESPYKLLLRFYVLGLIFLLIWWNSNPLFGGQTESILAWTFLAVLVSVAQLERRRVEQRLINMD